MRYLGPLSRPGERRQRPLAQSDPFASSFAAVEQWNPTRYAAETNLTPRSLPTGTTGQASSAPARAGLGMYLPFAVLVVIVYALEKWKGRLLGVKV